MNQMVRSNALVGEILAEDDDLCVFVAPHPLRTQRAEHRLPAGSTIAEIVIFLGDATEITMQRRWTVYLDGHPIPSDRWNRVRPKPGTTLVLRAVASDPISAIVGLFTALTSAVTSISTALAGLGFLGQVIGAGLSLAANFVLNALFGARKPELQKPPEAEKAKPSYSISASRNQAAPWEAVPVVLGEHRVTPYYGALPYTESVGEDQYLRLKFVWGYGPLAVDEIKIGESSIEGFADVQVETRFGFPDDAPTTIYTRQVVEEPLSIELHQADGWQRRTTAKDVVEIQFDVIFPDGIYKVLSGNNDKLSYAVLIEGRYRPVGSEIWNPMPPIDINTIDINTIRRTSALYVGLGQWEVEFRKASPDKHPADPTFVAERAVLTALRGFRTDVPISFPKPLAYTDIRIRATSQLNGQLDTLNGRCRAFVTSFNGGSWAMTVSRNPADAFRHVLQSPANARPRPDSAIDLLALQGWHPYCVSEGFTYDHVRIDRVSVFDALLDICSAGRAMPIFKDGLWSVIWDERDSPIVQMFTPANSWGFQSTRQYAEPVHAWRVRFINREKGYVEDERIVYDDGYSAANATRFEGIEFPGVTDPAAIWKHGRFHIAQMRLRPETYTVNVDFENLVCTRGDRVRVAHDAALIGVQSGRVTAIDAAAQSVTLNETILIGEGAYRLRFRLADGSFLVRDVASPLGTDSRTLLLSGTGALPEVGDLFAFGLRDIETVVLRVLSIEPQDELTARITLVDDAPEIYAADTGTIPAFESNVTAPIDPFTLPPLDVVHAEEADVEGGGSTAIIRVSWRVARLGQARAFEVQYKGLNDWRSAGVVLAPATQIEVRGFAVGEYTFRVRTIFADNSVSSWATTETFSLIGVLGPPGTVAGFDITANGETATLSWSPPQNPVRYTEIRYSPATSGATWADAVPIVSNAIGNSTQIAFQSGTYLAKHVSYSGFSSPDAALIVVTNAGIGARNVVEEFLALSFDDGDHDRTWDAPFGLELLPAFDPFAAADIFAFPNVFLGYDGFVPSGTFTFDEVTDLGEVFTSRLTATVMAGGVNVVDDIFAYEDVFSLPNVFLVDPSDWSVEVQVSTTRDDPAGAATWSAWERVIVGDYTARAYRFRLALRQSRFGVTPRVTLLQVIVDMPDRVEGGRDIVVPTTGRRVVFAPQFRAVEGLSRSDQDLAAGDRAVVSDLGPSGFDIVFVNSAGSPVERSFDFVATGYGRRIV